MPKFYTSVILPINQSKEIGEKQLSDFGSRGGQNSPLMHIFIEPLWQELAYGKHLNYIYKILNDFLVLLSNKMLVIRAGIHKMLVRIANREDPDQTASEAV